MESELSQEKKQVAGVLAKNTKAAKTTAGEHVALPTPRVLAPPPPSRHAYTPTSAFLFADT